MRLVIPSFASHDSCLGAPLKKCCQVLEAWLRLGSAALVPGRSDAYYPRLGFSGLVGPATATQTFSWYFAALARSAAAAWSRSSDRTRCAWEPNSTRRS